GSLAARAPCASLAVVAAAAALLSLVARADLAPARTSLPPLARATAPPEGATSVLLVTLDATRRDALGCYGQERATTPSLDALAAAGVVFEDATAEAPHTHPSIATVLTSRWPLEHGSISGSPRLSARVQTLAEHARTHGYRTAGFLDNPWLGPDFGIARGYEHLDQRPDLDRIARWMKSVDGEPFLLHVHYFHPHGPYELRADELEAIGGTTATAEARESVSAYVPAPVIRAGEVPGRHPFDDDELAWVRDLYLSEVRAMDADVGALVALVDERVGLDRTVVVVAADHGEEFDERRSLHHSHTLFQELVGVPLIVRPPGGGGSGARVDDPVGLVDVAPTILELAGLPPLPDAAGRSLVPLLRGESLDAPAVIVTQRYAHAGERRLAAIREGRWKLHLRAGPLGPLVPDGRPLADDVALFDLAADPGERTDRSGDEAATVDRLLKALGRWERGALERIGGDAPSARTDESLTPAQRARLRQLGYGG
ncbi:MAG: sulfatase, partial [Planctomycetota bacterium]